MLEVLFHCVLISLDSLILGFGPLSAFCYEVHSYAHILLLAVDFLAELDAQVEESKLKDVVLVINI